MSADGHGRAGSFRAVTRASGNGGSSRDEVGGRQLLLALVVGVVLAVAAGAATRTGLSAVAPGWAAGPGGLVLVVAEVYLSLLLGLLLAFGGFSGVRDRLRFRYTSVQDLGLALDVLALCLVAIALAYVALGPLIGPPQDAALQLLRFISDMSRLSDASPLALGLIVLRACLLAPLAEELLFRGALFGWARRYLPAWPTILLTSALFAAIHASATLLLVPFTLLFGIGGGWVRERTGSTLPFFTAHVATDAVLLVVAGVLVASGVVT